MTAQIVILNRSAIALASDSSVTLTMGEGRQRTFPSAEKVHPLLAPHAIAVLHAGNTALLRVPYEVLLGEWRAQLATVDRLATVADYVDHFLAWVADQADLFSRETLVSHLEWLLRDYWMSVRRELISALQEAGVADEPWEDPAVQALTSRVHAGRLATLRTHPTLKGWSRDRAAAFLARHEEQVDAVLTYVFDDVPRSRNGDRDCRSMAAELLAREEPFTVDATLTFVGYGAAQIMPALCQVDIRGVADGTVVETGRTLSEISDSSGSSIHPVGLTEAVHTFLRGYDRSSILTEVHAQLDIALDEIDAQSRQRHHEALEDGVEKLSWERFVQPMLDTITALPTADLARMAESLVGLQVLRQMTQAEAETVGGPIDVAVITRADGFRWVRHKSTPGHA